MATGYVRATRVSADEQVNRAAAVDDLIKYRLIESMLRQPEARVAALEIASRLGFHSVELTGTALDELVSAGLAHSTRSGGGELLYKLSAEPRLRAELTDLVAAGPPGLFNRLAAGSVSRIKKLLGKRI